MSADSTISTSVRPGSLIAAISTCAMMACVLVRCLVASETFPAWGSDPFLLPAPSVSLNPSALLALDAAAALLGVVACVAARVAPAGVLSVLTAAGACVAWVHARESVDHLILGSAWSSAMAVGLFAHTLSARPALRRLMLGLALAAVIAMAAKGVVQVYVDHPQTLASFQRDKGRIFESHGWLPDSPQAKAFERRLSQPEATAWFGLANVTATFAAGAFVVLACLVVRTRTMGTKTLATLGASAGAAALLVVLAGSKGGFAASGLALLTAGLAAMVSRRRAPRWLGWIGVMLVAVVLVGLAARGLIGERLGEKSLLFRWFYAVGSARIIAEHWLWGVGPAGFKDAYVLAKLPIAPEDVTSPHNLLLDFPATLGLGGVAWCAVWLTWVRRAGTDLAATADSTPEDDDVPTGMLIRLAILTLTVATAVAVRCEAAITTPETSLARVAALVLGSMTAGVLIAMGRRHHTAVACSAAAGGLAVAMLGLIDLAPVGGGSSALFMVLVAIAGAPNARAKTIGWSRRSLAVAVALAGAGSAVLNWTRISRWETLLESAAAPLRDAGTVQARLESLSAPGTDDSFERVVAELSTLAGHPVQPEASAVRAAVLDVRRAATQRAVDLLIQAADVEPSHPGTLEAATGQALALAENLRASDPARAESLRAAAIALADRQLLCPVGKSSTLVWRSSVAFREQGVPGLELAIALLQKARALDPYNPQTAVRLAEYLERAGRFADAKAQARAALELDDHRRLDPLMQMDPPLRAKVEALARGPVPGSTGKP